MLPKLFTSVPLVNDGSLRFLMDEGLLFTHGVVWKAGMDGVIMHHISVEDAQGMCHSVGDRRVEL